MAFLEIKNLKKISIFDAIISMQKRRSAPKVNYIFFHSFETFIPSSSISFRQVNAHILLNVTTNGSFTTRKIPKISILRLLF